jgi:hypothetical protein
MCERATVKRAPLARLRARSFPVWMTPIWRCHKPRLETPVDAGSPTGAGIRCLAAAQRSAQLRNEFQVGDDEPLWSAVRPAEVWPVPGFGLRNGNADACRGPALAVLLKRSVNVVGIDQTLRGSHPRSSAGISQSRRRYNDSGDDALFRPCLGVRMWSTDSGWRKRALECAMATSVGGPFRNILGTRPEHWYPDGHGCAGGPRAAPRSWRPWKPARCQSDVLPEQNEDNTRLLRRGGASQERSDQSIL